MRSICCALMALVIGGQLCASDHLQVVGQAEGSEAMVSYVQDDRYHVQIVKQLKGKNPDDHFPVVLETLASYMAECAGIPLHRVRIIPAGTEFVGKETGYPGTLHTVAPGASIETLGMSIDMHQKRTRTCDSSLGRLYGPLTKEEAGLTIAIISSMSQHPDLPLIVALDTFVNNGDRSAPNLFYDRATDRFCGIDMAASFGSAALGELACYHVQDLLDTETHFTLLESKALRSYRDTLKLLSVQFPPEAQERLLQRYAQEAGFREGSWLFDQDVQDRLYFHKLKIRENYRDCQRLLALLDQLLGCDEARSAATN